MVFSVVSLATASHYLKNTDKPPTSSRARLWGRQDKSLALAFVVGGQLIDLEIGFIMGEVSPRAILHIQIALQYAFGQKRAFPRASKRGELR